MKVKYNYYNYNYIIKTKTKNRQKHIKMIKNNKNYENIKIIICYNIIK